MRLGEVRDLLWGDIDPEAGIIHIRHNWQDLEEIKAPKNGEPRDVPLPLAVKEAGEACQVGERWERENWFLAGKTASL
jgi:integrase